MRVLSSALLSRRQFTQLTGLVAGSLAGLGRLLEGAAATGKVAYRFDPSSTCESDGAGSCASCSACLKHAENKRFVSREAAEQGRAHPNCRCAIVSERVTERTFEEYFGASRGVERRTAFDFRWSPA